MTEFRSYRKTTPTIARVLTEIDYDARGGIIQTPENPSSFLPGDYLARDFNGEWPIPVTHIRAFYKRISLADETGFTQYQSLGIRFAVQMPEPFEVDGLRGKAGDYLVKSGENKWPVEREIFEVSYILVGE